MAKPVKPAAPDRAKKTAHAPGKNPGNVAPPDPVSLEVLTGRLGPNKSEKPSRGLSTPTLSGFSFDLNALPIAELPALPASRSRPSSIAASSHPQWLKVEATQRQTYELYQGAGTPHLISATDLEAGFITIGYQSLQIGTDASMRFLCDSSNVSKSSSRRIVALKVEGVRRDGEKVFYVSREGWFDAVQCKGQIETETQAVLGNILPGLIYGFRACAAKEQSVLATGSRTPTISKEPCITPDQLVVLVPKTRESVASGTIDVTRQWASRVTLSTRRGNSSSMSASVDQTEVARFAKATRGATKVPSGQLLVQIEVLSPSDSPSSATAFVGTSSNEPIIELFGQRKRL